MNLRMKSAQPKKHFFFWRLYAITFVPKWNGDEHTNENLNVHALQTLCGMHNKTHNDIKWIAIQNVHAENGEHNNKKQKRIEFL